MRLRFSAGESILKNTEVENKEDAIQIAIWITNVIPMVDVSALYPGLVTEDGEPLLMPWASINSCSDDEIITHGLTPWAQLVKLFKAELSEVNLLSAAPQTMNIATHTFIEKLSQKCSFPLSEKGKSMIVFALSQSFFEEV